MKNLNQFWVLLVPAFFLLNGCEPKATVDVNHTTTSEVNMDSVKMQITALEAAYADASNRNDADGVAAYYAADAQSYPPNEPAIVGHDAIKARIRQQMDKDTSVATMALTTTGVWAAGNYVTETGTWSDMDKDGKVVATGKYMTLFELRDGKYVAIRDIWNGDALMKMDAMQ